MVVLLIPELLWLVLQVETSPTFWNPAIFLEVADLGRLFGIAKWVKESFLMDLSTFITSWISQKMGLHVWAYRPNPHIAQTTFYCFTNFTAKEMNIMSRNSGHFLDPKSNFGKKRRIFPLQLISTFTFILFRIHQTERGGVKLHCNFYLRIKGVQKKVSIAIKSVLN